MSAVPVLMPKQRRRIHDDVRVGEAHQRFDVATIERRNQKADQRGAPRETHEVIIGRTRSSP